MIQNSPNANLQALEASLSRIDYCIQTGRNSELKQGLDRLASDYSQKQIFSQTRALFDKGDLTIETLFVLGQKFQSGENIRNLAVGYVRNIITVDDPWNGSVRNEIELDVHTVPDFIEYAQANKAHTYAEHLVEAFNAGREPKIKPEIAKLLIITPEAYEQNPSLSQNAACSVLERTSATTVAGDLTVISVAGVRNISNGLLRDKFRSAIADDPAWLGIESSDVAVELLKTFDIDVSLIDKSLLKQIVDTVITPVKSEYYTVDLNLDKLVTPTFMSTNADGSEMIKLIQALQDFGVTSEVDRSAALDLLQEKDNLSTAQVALLKRY